MCVRALSITLLLALLSTTEFASGQTVVMEFYDDQSGEPVSARIQWTKGAKRITRPRALLGNGDWWLATPDFSITPREGEYEFIVHRGPEFSDIRGGFEIERASRDVVPVEIPRSTHMHEEFWYSADHSSTLPPDQTLRWQKGDAIDLVSIAEGVMRNTTSPSTTTATPPRPVRSDPKKAYEKLVESTDPDAVGMQMQTSYSTYNAKHGKVRLHRLPLPNVEPSEEKSDTEPEIELPKPRPLSFGEVMERIEAERQEGTTFVELVDPWSRDTPILLATGLIHAVQTLNGVSRPRTDESLVLNIAKEREGIFGRIRRTHGKDSASFPVFAPFEDSDRIVYKTGRGAGQLTEHVYWKMLDAGLRLTPTAGSDFGVTETHLGYNRTYFYSEVRPTSRDWVAAVRDGKTMVTNGPLLRAYLNGMPPGGIFRGTSGQSIDLDFQVSLTVREPVDYLDVIFNGETLYSAKLEDHYKKGEFPPMKIDKSGWLLIRVVTAHEKGYRLASTSPFYFVFDGKPHISKEAVQFMQGWLSNAEENIRSTEAIEEYSSWIDRAQTFWGDRLHNANAP